jgi:leucyl-tRNA synthetase
VVHWNGKLRERLEVAPGRPAGEVVALARALLKVAAAADCKRVVRKVVVPDKLVNLVMK